MFSKETIEKLKEYDVVVRLEEADKEAKLRLQKLKNRRIR